MTNATLTRCDWCLVGAQGPDPLYLAYHDHEWGVPQHDEHRLFEFLVLEGAQAGLSWLTILRKRVHFRAAYAQFDPQQVAQFGAQDVQRLLQDPGIIRNRQKIQAAIGNAQAFLDIQARYGSFDRYLWNWVDGRPLHNRWREMQEVPASTPLSTRLSRDLHARGMRFVGPVICYSLMQAVGLVNDHLVGCHRHAQLQSATDT